MRQEIDGVLMALCYNPGFGFISQYVHDIPTP